MASERLQVLLELVTGNYKREAREAAAATGKIGEAAAKSGADLKKLGGNISSLGSSLTASLTLPLAAAATAAVKTASDLSESMNAVDVIFERSAGKVHAFGQTAAEAAGLSARAFNQSVVPIGALLNNFDFSVDESADAVLQLTQRAADLGSTLNVDTSVALDKFRAGLAGEAEPLKAFGVDVSVAALKQEALALGLIKSGDELDRNARAQAAFSIIMRETNFAAGDFARTFGESLPNQLKALKADTENIAASFGQTLLPVLLDMTSHVRELLARFNDLTPEMQGFIVKTAGVVAAIGPSLFVIGKLIQVVTSLRLALLGANLALGGTATVMTTRVIPGIGSFTVATEKANTGLGGLAGTAGIVTAAIVALEVGLDAAKTATADWVDSANDWQQASGGFIQGVSTLDVLLGDYSGAIVAAAEATEQFKTVGEKTADATKGTGGALQFMADATRDDLVPAVSGALRPVNALRTAQQEAAEATRNHVNQIIALTTRLAAAINPAIGTYQALQDLEQAHRDAKDAAEEHGSKSEEAALAQLILAEKIAIAEGALAQFGLNAESSVAAVATALGITEDAARTLLDTLGLLDGLSIEMQLVLRQVSLLEEGAIPEGQGISRGSTTTVTVGGPFHQGGVVPGPRGSEQLILAHAGETVLPTHKPSSQNITRNGPTINLQATGYTQPDLQYAAIVGSVLSLVENY